MPGRLKGYRRYSNAWNSVRGDRDKEDNNRIKPESNAVTRLTT